VKDLINRIQLRVDALPTGLQSHIYRAREVARELAQRHGVDEERAALGMLAHDVARATPGGDLLRHAAELGLDVGTVERVEPLLLHGPVGAEWLARDDGLDDPSLHRAVYWHTTGHPSLDDLGGCLFGG
jgi:HD superfamily phosphohydrolase YqeK